MGYPVKTAAEARQLASETQRLIEAIQPNSIVGLRDSAIIGVMGYALASVDAVLRLRVRDYYFVGDRRWIRLVEKGVERHEIVDRRLEVDIDQYLAAAQIAGEPRSPLFRTTFNGTLRISPRPVAGSGFRKMILRRWHEAAHSDSAARAERP